MTEPQIAWLLLIATLWTLWMVPLLFFHTIHKFMEVMRRTTDDKPW